VPTPVERLRARPVPGHDPRGPFGAHPPRWVLEGSRATSGYRRGRAAWGGGNNPPPAGCPPAPPARQAPPAARPRAPPRPPARRRPARPRRLPRHDRVEQPPHRLGEREPPRPAHLTETPQQLDAELLVEQVELAFGETGEQLHELPVRRLPELHDRPELRPEP